MYNSADVMFLFKYDLQYWSIYLLLGHESEINIVTGCDSRNVMLVPYFFYHSSLNMESLIGIRKGRVKWVKVKWVKSKD